MIFTGIFCKTQSNTEGIHMGSLTTGCKFVLVVINKTGEKEAMLRPPSSFKME